MSKDNDEVLCLYPRSHPEAVGRMLDGEAVIVTANDAKMHTLNEVGTFLWQRCDGKRSVKGIIAELLEYFEVDEETATVDVCSFMTMLVDRKILELHKTPGADIN